jgi:DNA-binding Lrp family transcriptional regulator
MNETTVFQNDLTNTAAATPSIAKKGSLLLRLIRAAQPITRTEIATRLDIDKSTVTENVKPLIAAGILREETLEVSGQGRKPRVLSFVDENDYFIGVNLGVRTSQVGMTTLKGEISDEDDFITPSNAGYALKMVRERIDKLIEANSDKVCRVIGVSVPGLTDAERRRLVYAPNLDWRDIDITAAL